MPSYSEQPPEARQWYNNPVYNRYWMHYSMVQDWLRHCRRSQDMARLSAAQDMNCACCEQLANYSPPDCCSGTCYPSQHQSPVLNPQYQNPEYYDCFPMGPQEMTFDENEDAQGDDEEEEEEEEEECFEMVVSAEWIALMKHSEKFRRERDALKQAENRLREKVEFVELGSFQKNQEKAIGLRAKNKAAKEKEMERMYGSRAPHIKSMEIAMQLNFDHYYDLKRPTLWPVIPLKL